ncbi:MAG: hypothetical protein ABI479_00725 [Gallionella sp.]
MITYAVGDIQSCYIELMQLIEHTRFDPTADRLWLVGDLVIRANSRLSSKHMQHHTRGCQKVN